MPIFVTWDKSLITNVSYGEFLIMGWGSYVRNDGKEKANVSSILCGRRGQVGLVQPKIKL